MSGLHSRSTISNPLSFRNLIPTTRYGRDGCFKDAVCLVIDRRVFYNTKMLSTSLLNIFGNVTLLEFYNTKIFSASRLNIFGNVTLIKFIATIHESNNSLTIYGSVPSIKMYGSVFATNPSLSFTGDFTEIEFYRTDISSTSCFNVFVNASRL
ncbi:hypothetical protein GJ496_000637 [Pomphorhynchus laevis]|nr:hypothetical protein GJ496_000637 [Pomphorhynchus laevis]